MFWANKKTLHGFCSAYQQQEYTLSPDCFNEQFQLTFYDKYAEIFEDILALQIFNTTVFDDHMLEMFSIVENELITCGCKDWLTDAQNWYADNIATASFWGGFFTIFKQVASEYVKHFPEITLSATLQVLTTVTFNFYYLGFSLGKLDYIIFKDHSH